MEGNSKLENLKVNGSVKRTFDRLQLQMQEEKGRKITQSELIQELLAEHSARAGGGLPAAQPNPFDGLSVPERTMLTAVADLLKHNPRHRLLRKIRKAVLEDLELWIEALRDLGETD